MLSLVGRSATLDELPTGQFGWSPSSHLQGPSMGRLVTDFRFLTAGSYCSPVCATGSEGPPPFYEENPWTLRGRDPNVDQDS